MASDSISDHHGSEKNPRITLDSVLQALETLKESNGTSLSSLKKYFSSNLPGHISSSDISFQLKKAVEKGIRDGKISKHGRSKFLLGVDDDEGSRKRRRKTDDDDSRSHRRRRSRRRRCRRRRRRSRCRRRRRRSRGRRSRRRRCRRRRRRSRRRR